MTGKDLKRAILSSCSAHTIKSKQPLHVILALHEVKDTLLKSLPQNPKLTTNCRNIFFTMNCQIYLRVICATKRWSTGGFSLETTNTSRDNMILLLYYNHKRPITVFHYTLTVRLLFWPPGEDSFQFSMDLFFKPV